MNEFVTAEFLGTFAGLVVAVGIVVEVLKFILNDKITSAMVRPIAFVVATILTFIFMGDLTGIQGIVLTILNSLLITLASASAHDFITDPKAKK